MRDDGGPAFPIPAAHFECGISMRDWFAGQALVGFIVHAGLADPARQVHAESYAAAAYRLADTMLAERMKEVPQ